MSSAVLGSIGRGLGWVGTTVVGLVLPMIVGVLPLSLLPGQVHTDFVHGQWIKLGGIGFVVTMMCWRLSPMNRNVRFSPSVAGKFIWLTVTASVLAFWPLGLAVWVNAHNSKLKGIHDMIVTGREHDCSAGPNSNSKFRLA